MRSCGESSERKFIDEMGHAPKRGKSSLKPEEWHFQVLPLYSSQT